MAQMAGPSEVLEEDSGRRGQYGPSVCVMTLAKVASVNLETQSNSVGLIAAVRPRQIHSKTNPEPFQNTYQSLALLATGMAPASLQIVLQVPTWEVGMRSVRSKSI